MGVLVSVLLQVDNHSLAAIIPVWLVFLLPLPAVYDFTTHQLELRRSNNAIRMVSGLLLGFAVCVGVYAVVSGYTLLGVLQIVWLVALEFAVALIMRYSGRLDTYIDRYEKAVRKQ